MCINASKSLHPKADRFPGVAEVATKGRKHRSLPRLALPLSTVENQKFLFIVSSVVLLPTVRLRYVPMFIYISVLYLLYDVDAFLRGY